MADDPTETLLEDLRKLEARLAEVRAAREAQAAAAARETALTEGIAAVSGQLRARRAGRRPSPLDTIRIASPCSADWDAMTGDDRVRFCGECKKNVYDLSALTRQAAEELLVREAGACVQIYRRADGTVLTSDCPVGRRRLRVRRVVAVAGAGMFAAAALLSQGEEPPREVTMKAVQTRAAALESAVRFADPPAPEPIEAERSVLGRRVAGRPPSPFAPPDGRGRWQRGDAR